MAALAAIMIGVSFAKGARAQPSSDLDENSANGPCSAIHHKLTNLAQAERDQGLALELFSRGGELAIVETRYQRMQQVGADLREILRKAHANRLGSDPSVAECLKLGYQALFAADKVASEVERILVKAHGDPLVRLGE